MVETEQAKTVQKTEERVNGEECLFEEIREYQSEEDGQIAEESDQSDSFEETEEEGQDQFKETDNRADDYEDEEESERDEESLVEEEEERDKWVFPTEDKDFERVGQIECVVEEGKATEEYVLDGVSELPITEEQVQEPIV